MKPSIRFTRLHFIGIGGSGMSVLAEVLASWGFRISGSDGQGGETVSRLKALGMRVEVGHRAENVGEANVVVYSSAVPDDNPELAEARRRGIPAVKRAEMLGEALRGKYPLAVSGTHGKTTTTTMLGRIWLHAGKDPTLLAGGTARGENLSAVAGQGQILIVEADEFDRSFLAMRPASAIIGNIDSDHLDCYGTVEGVRDAFAAFAESLPFYGLVVANRDDEGVRAILPRLTRRTVTYGRAREADYRAADVRPEGQGMVFILERKGAKLGEVVLKVPGIHNVYNALGAAALSLEEGLSFKEVERGLREYPGVKRRLEYRGQKSGVTFYDDYAHHPTEVAAALQAARGLTAAGSGETGRLIAVFQPHLYSRTRQLHLEFAQAFKACDELFVTRVYAAREAPIPGVEGDLIADAAANGVLPAGMVHYIEDLETLPALVAASLRAGDLVVTMGAGDIGMRCTGIMEALA
ncbi:MAG TPA: UDP-N-acetylmuramate--L-alanine ligase [Fibrobacteria bacterium]|nr:UDP-N-acetylmuramate--L-alanine ligase [Fibrobacteria bacterium]